MEKTGASQVNKKRTEILGKKGQQKNWGKGGVTFKIDLKKKNQGGDSGEDS